MRPPKIKKTQIVFGQNFDLTLKTIYSRKSCPTTYVRNSDSVGEIISKHGCRVMYVKGIKKGISIFNMVRYDVEKYRKVYVIDFDVYPETTRKINPCFNSNKKLILTDMQHAYWRVAYLNKIISEKTYNYGINKEYKILRNQALSVLGTPKYYEEWKNGKPTGKTVIFKQEDEELRRIYHLIRYECCRITEEISDKLKDDWVEWNTDGIVYVDTPKNRKIAEAILTKENMLFVHKTPTVKEKKALYLRRERAITSAKKSGVSNESTLR